MADWASLSNVATGGGTLVLALATFASVRSANRSARLAERTLLHTMRPVLVQSRLEDRTEKIFWGDRHGAMLKGGHAIAECVDGNVYLAMSLRNVGNGIGILRAWELSDAPSMGTSPQRPSTEGFHPHSRHMYVPPGDLSFWQAGLRDHDDPDYGLVRGAIERREPFAVFVYYTDHEGGQPTVSRFNAMPVQDDEWLSAATHHWPVPHHHRWSPSG
jgi:hypothetical protein